MCSLNDAGDNSDNSIMNLTLDQTLSWLWEVYSDIASEADRAFLSNCCSDHLGKE